MTPLTHAQRLQRIRQFQQSTRPADQKPELLMEAFEGLGPAEARRLLQESGLQLQPRPSAEPRSGTGNDEGEDLNSFLPFMPLPSGGGSSQSASERAVTWGVIVLGALLVVLSWLLRHSGCNGPGPK